jgi:PIN domain-containing protein
VKWHDDLFGPRTPDQVWLQDIGTEGWLLISRDKRIKNRPGEKQALIDNGVGGFYLTQRDGPTRWQILQLLCRTIDEMERIFAQTPRPFLYGVTKEAGLHRII